MNSYYYLGERNANDDLLQAELAFTKPSVQRHLPQDCQEQSSRTSVIPCGITVRLARRLLVVLSNTCCSTTV
ncbi:hypothetical protein TNCV_4833361 [Trichonephila clavipes]|nr:hypothetical protein TNCV_4833361 [Trichonephila clavipes]